MNRRKLAYGIIVVGVGASAAAFVYAVASGHAPLWEGLSTLAELIGFLLLADLERGDRDGCSHRTG